MVKTTHYSAVDWKIWSDKQSSDSDTIINPRIAVDELI